MKLPHGDSLERIGYEVLPDLLAPDLRRELAELFDRSQDDNPQGLVGLRNGLDFEPVRAAAASAAVVAVVRSTLGDGAFVVKATLFDKAHKSNWLVPWHQDVMIPVRERRETAGFEAWSVKDDIAYARPPVEVLESMLAIRLDLDGSTAWNGPLRVIPKTHKRGILSADAVAEIRRSESPVECLVHPAGGLVMRPLLSHASSRASKPSQRRILHLEFARDDLPGGLAWFYRHAIPDPRSP